MWKVTSLACFIFALEALILLHSDRCQCGRQKSLCPDFPLSPSVYLSLCCISLKMASYHVITESRFTSARPQMVSITQWPSNHVLNHASVYCICITDWLRVHLHCTNQSCGNKSEEHQGSFIHLITLHSWCLMAKLCLFSAFEKPMSRFFANKNCWMHRAHISNLIGQNTYFCSTALTVVPVVKFFKLFIVTAHRQEFVL